MTLSLLVSEVKCLISSPFCNEKFQIKKVYTGLNGNGNFTVCLENDCFTHADR